MCVLVEYGRAGGAGQPVLRQLVEGAGLAQSVHRRGEALGERAALAEHEAELLRRTGDRELADDRRPVQLGCGDVQAGREVDDEGIDLLVLQGLYGKVVGGDLAWRPAGLELVGDRSEARGALLRAELGALQPGD